MVLYLPDWTNIGFSVILLTANLFCHPTFYSYRARTLAYSIRHKQALANITKLKHKTARLRLLASI